ncbi:MAG: dTDP-4-dehydrorhamnose 3,5-epimerase [Bacteroidales bacterium]|jgi:dTDP-4-dehydrorhamnose 3,5-epimerase|nr:dTDP-4-dehydrorhamnose 3,5-epimerase [Bacteroidales bacterium]
MRVTETEIPGLLIIEPRIFDDPRGYFFESYREELYRSFGITASFVQDNESKSIKGVVRGLHYQLEPYAQSKLVRVVCGRVYDVAVDLRKGSPSFGRWFGVILDDIGKKQLFIPKGFAHGFSVLSETAVFSYKCDNVYNGNSERAVNINDPDLGINWMTGSEKPVVSDKDLSAPMLVDAEMNFIFTRV